jgi:hypothetical protein
MMIEIANNPRSRTAMALSVFIHVGIVALLFLKVFLSPDPPLEQERIMVSLASLGDSNDGGGESKVQPVTEPQETNPNPEVAETSPTESAPQDISTQSESTVQTPSSDSQDKPVEEVKEEEPEVSSELQDLFGTLTDGDDPSHGEESGPDHQGTDDGSIQGMGVIGSKSPFGYNLDGRDIMGSPSLDEAPTQAGIVVFNIYVKRNGEIRNYTRNYSLSNTSSDYLFRLGEKALETVKFAENSQAPPIQQGTFTFNFKLK